MIVVVAPLAGRLADRYGPRWLIGGGLLLLTGSLASFSGIATDSSYLDLLPGFMLLGVGIAMTMSPMTSAAMNAVPVEKAGIASGVLSMFRMVGGSLGVAVTGAIFQSLSSDRLGTLLAGSGIPAEPAGRDRREPRQRRLRARRSPGSPRRRPSRQAPRRRTPSSTRSATRWGSARPSPCSAPSSGSPRSAPSGAR